MIHPYFSDESKQDSITTTAHRKRIIELSKQIKIPSDTISTVWEDIYGCAKHYRCATELYLMSMLSQAF